MPLWRENPVKWDKTNIEIKSLFLKFKDSIENSIEKTALEKDSHESMKVWATNPQRSKIENA